MPPQAVAQPQHLERFKREARAAAKLHHTNIVPVFGVGEQGGVHYYVMQYVEGASLAAVSREAESAEPSAGAATHWRERPTRGVRARLRGLRLAANRPEPSAEAAAKIGRQIADALAYAHAQGVLHRDVKPANILLAGGVPYLADFGLAKLADGDDLTGPGAFLGTYRYAAPEQFRGEFDARSDVYALGVTLYELLAGRPAFDGSGREQLLKQITDTEPPRPRLVNPSVPRDLETVVLKAMAKEPARRYQSAGELRDDLGRFLAGEPVRARRTGPVGRAWRWAKRNPAVAGLLAGIFAVLAAGAAGTTWKWREAVAHERAAKSARGVAEENWKEAVFQQGEATAARRHAEANFDWSRQVLDKFLRQAETLQKGAPALAGADRLLGQLAEQHAEFARLRADDPAARAEAVRAARRTGEISDQLGRTEAAETALRLSVTMAEKLVEQTPADESAREALARSLDVLALFLADQNRFVEADQTCWQAVEWYEALGRDDPDPDKHLRSLALVLGNRAGVLRRRGQPADAVALYRRAIDLLAAPVPRSNPGVVLHGLTQYRLGLSQALKATGDEKAATAELATAAELAARLRVDFRPFPALQGQVAAVYAVQAQSLFAAGDRAATERLSREEVVIRRELLASNPGVVGYQCGLGGALNNLAMGVRSHSPQEAAALYDEAIKLQLGVLAVNPRHFQAAGHLRLHYEGVGRLHLLAGDHAAAAKMADTLAAGPSLAGRECWMAARILANCNRAAAADKMLADADRAARAKGYADRAVAMLRTALLRGYRDGDGLKDAAFNSVRDRADFRQLVAELKAVKK
jgi:tRNA A-37 threonylcarbamoyl transferase component Bud32/tetratricopeptide (TPR) repeat protein